jgi:hypothetical protein
LVDQSEGEIMNLTLFYNASERKVIGKSLQNLGTTTGILKGDASITSPVFILQSNNNYLSGVNYLYWQETGRYYYIDDIELYTEDSHYSKNPDPADRHRNKCNDCQLDSSEREPKEEKDYQRAGPADIVEIIGKVV